MDWFLPMTKTDNTCIKWLSNKQASLTCFKQYVTHARLFSFAFEHVLLCQCVLLNACCGYIQLRLGSGPISVLFIRWMLFAIFLTQWTSKRHCNTTHCRYVLHAYRDIVTQHIQKDYYREGTPNPRAKSEVAQAARLWARKFVNLGEGVATLWIEHV